MSNLVFSSLRVRLTIWYLLFFAALLCGFSAFIYALLSSSLYRQLDASLSSTAESASGLFRTESQDRGGVDIGANRSLVELRLSKTMLAFFDGPRLLASTDPRLPALSSLRDLVAKSEAARHPVAGNIQELGITGSRAIVTPVEVEHRSCFVAAVEPLDPVTIQLKEFRRILYFAVPLSLIVAAIGGFLVAGRSLAPLTGISQQAELITASNLHTRLNIGDSQDELGRLAGVINSLLSRLDQSFESMRRFVADASHELRTPLAIMRAETDVSLSRDRPASEYKESLGIIQDETRRLSRLIDDLLDLARADAGHQPLNVERFYLNDVLEECCRSAQALAKPKDISLTMTTPGDVPFRGDQDLIRRMIFNLLDNATRYTPAGGSVSASIDVADSTARLKISDTGIGIPAEAADRIFERFFRVDKARSRAAGGYGLGLSIVKWVAESHRGSVQVASQPEKGCSFTVSLPIEGTR